MANFNIPYEIEREGQIDFFDNYSIPYSDDASILIDNTDGVYNGNILEFKLTINNLNKTLFQAIKYLSKMRIKGQSVPATILLIDLNSTTVYVYKSENYRVDIHKVYTGAASKDNEGFVAGNYEMKLDYSDIVQSAQVKKILKGQKKYPDEMFIPVDIDENCIVGWAERYYSEKPKASKGDFIGDDTGTAVKVTGEIREPRHFKGLINAYTGKSNEKFKYLMDCLNDRLSKKDLGAFYTPVLYAKKAVELVRIAVDRVPDENDYIILDRCAGTGNLEDALIGEFDKKGDELIGHCVVSTYEYYEYKVLQERIGDKVRDIIPPSEANVVYENGKVTNADALSEAFINNPIIRQYVDDPKCTIILFENPPYSDSTGYTHTNNEGKRQKNCNDSFVRSQFKTEIKKFGSAQASANELSNLFIWSGFKYYLRQPTDSYVVFSPVKYFKSMTLVNNKFLGGYLFNRKFFHATESAISCILWSNEFDNPTTWDIDALNIVNNDLVKENRLHLVRAYKSIAELQDKRPVIGGVPTTVVTEANGNPTSYVPFKGRQPIWSEDIIGYMEFARLTFSQLNQFLTRCNCLKGLKKSEGFHLRKDNYIEMLPGYCAKLFPADVWYEKEVYSTTADGGKRYIKDKQFLKSCLIYTCLSTQNKCLSFDGSDGRRYQNELCFDNSIRTPLALSDLIKFAKQKETALDDEEKTLLEVWEKIIAAARDTAKYNFEYNYGVYQISNELNTYQTIGTGKNKKNVYDYPELNGYLDTLRTMLKAYYKSHITEKMFKYELLK